MTNDLHSKSPSELLLLYADILTELKSRKIVRTNNSPVGDYAEWLVADKLNLQLEGNSTKGYDAVDPATGHRYQIKSRWERDAVPSGKTRELSAIRNANDDQFDTLIVLIFDENFNVKEAYSMPHSHVTKYGRYQKHTNSHILIAMGSILTDPQTTNITAKFL